jgi:hypothetical protein
MAIADLPGDIGDRDGRFGEQLSRDFHAPATEILAEAAITELIVGAH